MWPTLKGGWEVSRKQPTWGLVVPPWAVSSLIHHRHVPPFLLHDLIKKFKDGLFSICQKHKGKWLGHKGDDYILDGRKESQIMLYVVCFAKYNYSTCWEMR